MTPTVEERLAALEAERDIHRTLYSYGHAVDYGWEEQSMFARLDSYPDGPGICAFGRYTDALVRCPDGRWRFTDRHADIESWRHGPPPVLDARFRQARWHAWPPPIAPARL